MSERQKRREAALKAWETIRRKQQEQRIKGVSKLDKFIEVEDIGQIEHPEASQRTESNTWKGNGVIKLFDKTPDDILCGPFWEIRWAYGCPLNCSYCYLRGTMRGKMSPKYVRFEEIERCVGEAFSKISKPHIFNSGELSDSLMNPALMEKVADLFETQDKHKILLLSKFGTKNIGFLLEKLRKQTICAWSINTEAIASKWETMAAQPSDRIDAAALVWELGYDTRVRIDPIFPISDWKIQYSNLIEKIFSAFYPNRIILGTPRGLWKTIHYAEIAQLDMSWSKFFQEDTGWGKKLSFSVRKEIYQFLIDFIESFGYPIHKISICKESNEIWHSLGLKCKKNTCNCYGKEALK